MKILLFISSLLLLIACSAPEPTEKSDNLWSYTASHHQAVLDQAIKPMINGYNNLLQGFYNQDTIVINAHVNALLSLADSLIAHIDVQDSTQQKRVSTLQSIQSELEAMGLEQTIEGKQKSLSMLSVLLLNYLGDIGFQQNTIYIFNNAANEEQTWFGFAKTARSPYTPLDKAQVTANQILQEQP